MFVEQRSKGGGIPAWKRLVGAKEANSDVIIVYIDVIITMSLCPAAFLLLSYCLECAAVSHL